MSDDANLFDSVRAALRSDRRFTDTAEGIHCDGSVAPLTNIYPIEMTAAEWDGWESADSQMPDPTRMSALIFESRSPAWVAEVGALLARTLATPVWFVDTADIAWPADRVDPDSRHSKGRNWLGKRDTRFKKSGGHIQLRVEQGQPFRVGQHMDFNDSGPSDLQGDDPSQSPPVEREEEWLPLTRHFDQG
jgi:hypothetical protein